MRKISTKSFFVGKNYIGTTGLMLAFLLPNLGAIANPVSNNILQHSVIQETVQGAVTTDGSPLAGVTVSVKGRSANAITDSNGRYSIKASKGETLVFSIIGYETVEVVVNGTTVNANLKESKDEIEEVVVVAFGKQKKVNMTGAVSSISSKQLAERPVTSMQNALQGVAPGITVLSRPGEVAKGSASAGAITVRGRTNLGSPSPMFIIDGIPATSAEFSALSPNDIASMSVLKDAASASLYGSRAANGVILVTTKGGGGDRAVVGFSANYGLQSATYLPDFANSVDYITLYNRARRNGGMADLFTPEQIQMYKDGSNPDLYPNSDWYKEVLKSTAPQKDISVNITAPGKVTKYYLGLNYFDQESIAPGRSQKRISSKFNTTTEVVKDILKIGSNWSFLKQDYDRVGAGLNWVEMARALPLTVIRQSDGSWGSISNGVANATLAGNNQLRAITEGGRGNNRDNYFQGSFNGSLTPLKGLSIDGLVSLKYTNTNSFDFINRTNPVINFLTKEEMTNTANKVNEMKEYWGKREELLIQGTINYERTFAQHYGKVTVGSSQESNTYREAFLGRKNFVSNDLTTIGTGSSLPSDISSDGNGLANRTRQDEWAIRSFFGRFNYVYNDKYMFEANARMDYSSRFAPGYREAIFPSFSAGWNIDRESFMDNVTWVDALKLRGSWGALGNQDAVPLDNYLNTIRIRSDYNFEGVAVDGAQQNVPTNYYAKWEKVYMSNVGVDGTVLNGKLNFTLDYFIKDSRGILLQPTTSAYYGWPTAAVENQGQVRNKGLEVMLTYNGAIGDDFKYSVSGNMSYIKNKIVSLGNSPETISGLFINRINGSVGDFYGYKSAGIFTSQEEINNSPDQTVFGKPVVGDVKYVDVNGDGVLTTADRTVLGNDVPWVNYGFNLRGSYKNFDLDILTYGVAKVKTYMQDDAVQPFFNNGNVKTNWLNNGWTEENNRADADFPRITLPGVAPQNYVTSDFWLFNAAYFRIKAITLGYTFPAASISKIGMSQLRVFASSNNPFTILADKRLGDFDPETGSGRTGYPGIKTFSLGVTARF